LIEIDWKWLKMIEKNSINELPLVRAYSLAAAEWKTAAKLRVRRIDFHLFCCLKSDSNYVKMFHFLIWKKQRRKRRRRRKTFVRQDSFNCPLELPCNYPFSVLSSQKDVSRYSL
jgi:hypothetical protein